MTAQYYDQPGERMDLIPTVSYGLGIPFCIIATYVVERFGLKVGLHIGGFLTGIGELQWLLITLQPCQNRGRISCVIPFFRFLQPRWRAHATYPLTFFTCL